MAEKALPKIEKPTSTPSPVTTAASDVVASAKAFAGAAQTAVVEQGDKVKAKVVGTSDDTTQKAVEVKDKVAGTADDTKTNITQKAVEAKDKVAVAADDTKISASVIALEVKDKVVGATDDTAQKAVEVKDKVAVAADDTKISASVKALEAKDKVVGAADDTKTGATQQGGNVKDKVFGALGGALEATKTGVVNVVETAQGYLTPSTGPTAPAEDKKE